MLSKVIVDLDVSSELFHQFFMIWSCGWVAGNFQRDTGVLREEIARLDHVLSSGGCT